MTRREEGDPATVPELIARLEALIADTADHYARLAAVTAVWNAWYDEGDRLTEEHGIGDIERYRTVLTESLPQRERRDEHYREPYEAKQKLVRALHRTGDPRAAPVLVAALAVLAARSQTEVLRSRHRVVTAMRMQTVEQGRYLGGRPPYGYRLVDAGPHPNRALARRGVRQQRLVPNSATAPVVKLIFSLRLAGHSAAGIARHLNEQAVPSPTGTDAERKGSRVDHGWSLRTVVEILGNPRYTGHQVWNRTSADRATRSPSGRRASVRNEQHAWAISTRIAHTPLVSEQDFVTAQTVQATRQSVHQADSDGGECVYLLAGRLQCGLCGRRMDSHRCHGRAAYRCRHGHTSARTRPEGAPGNLYLREDHLLARIAAHLTAAGIADNPDPA
ncbi:recombinase family protein [Saccharothrix deserti]|uniref:recombinase family protein n=1 Tax=Saccharothrix deserti TaxID=2593674 RepID=UPI00131D867E|nr:recombinase family protein [Saccharothrix deserti]